MANLYRPSAHLYDLDPTDITKDDVSFYLQSAAAIGGEILELGCGTGRITLALAAAGHEICGLDLSAEMLAQLRAKLERLPEPAAARVTLVHENMARFDLKHKFDLIIAPYRAFQALTERADQERCLACIKTHLTESGRFILHVFKPKRVFDETWVQPESFDWEVTDPRTGKRVRRYEARRRIDLARQVLYVDLIYRIEGAERDVVEPLALSYFYEPQIRALLRANGLRIVEEYGYFDRRPIADGSELIFVVSR